MKKIMWWVSGLILLACGCVQAPCKRAQTDGDGVLPVAPAGGAAKNSSMDSSSRRVRVYKYDGSLQCRQGQTLSLEAMEKELKVRGINVYSSAKKVDGLMHIQVCGAPSGMANVYEISESHINEAEKAGFKKWVFE